MLRKSDAHEEGGERLWSVQTKRLEGKDGRVQRLHASRVEWLQVAGARPFMREISGGDFHLEVDLVILAMGFLGPDDTIPEQANLLKTPKNTIEADGNGMTSQDGVFVAGDAHRGASLVVWAIWEGRQVAKGLNRYLRRQAKELKV